MVSKIVVIMVPPFNIGWVAPIESDKTQQCRSKYHHQYQSYSNDTSACWQDADAYNLMRETSSQETIEDDVFSGNNRMAAIDLRSALSARWCNWFVDALLICILFGLFIGCNIWNAAHYKIPDADVASSAKWWNLFVDALFQGWYAFCLAFS